MIMSNIPLLTNVVSLTKNASDRVAVVMQDEGLNPETDYLRVLVLGGGCAGLQYSLDFDDSVSDFDLSFQSQDINIVIDCFSAQHLIGTEIDYVESLYNSGFKFNNTNKATRTCGCGMSFSTN